MILYGIQTLGILACCVLAGFSAAAIGPARRHDTHLMHRPGTCEECDR
ncbi:hypothetical protein [Pseudarthrobacter sp. NIBRBAC000502771]|nr:hypothetical protein [Pseudarthrobacter sp. NIBRBAC000502771]